VLTIPLAAWIANAAAVLTGPRGDITQRARDARCSRQTVYDHARKVHDAVAAEHQGGPPRQRVLDRIQALQAENAQLWDWLAQTIDFPAPRRDRFAVTAAAMGLSLSQIGALLAIVVGAAARPSRSALHRVVQDAGRRAGRVLEALDRRCRALILVGCLDEIFFHGRPVLVGVEPASMTWFLGRRAADRTGATWHEALRPWAALEYVVADAGKGLQAGIALLQQDRRRRGLAVPEDGLDVFHTAHEARQVLARQWHRVERLWGAAEAAEVRAERAGQQGQDRRGLAAVARAAWSRAVAAFTAYERGEASWEQARRGLDVFSPDGRLNDRARARKEIEAALPSLNGVEWSKMRGLLEAEASLTFLDRLHRLLEQAEPDADLRSALVRLWWLRRQRPRGTSAEAGGCGHVAHLVQMALCRGLSASWAASYRRVSRVLRQVVRASSAVECMNSVLRMHQSRHRTVTQEMLDLKRLYWNCRAFRDGKRQGRCPYEHLGLRLARYDFWGVLGMEPEAAA
jgi:hypothetical protein